eukprot:4722997-Prymnesium_polylepis.2
MPSVTTAASATVEHGPFIALGVLSSAGSAGTATARQYSARRRQFRAAAESTAAGPEPWMCQLAYRTNSTILTQCVCD